MRVMEKYEFYHKETVYLEELQQWQSTAIINGIPCDTLFTANHCDGVKDPTAMVRNRLIADYERRAKS